MRRQGAPVDREARPRPTGSPRTVRGGPRRRPQFPTAPSRRPRLCESGGREERRRPPQPRLHLQNARGSPSPQASRRPRKAPPAPRGKMAPVEQLRHQPWRRARPSAILAPCSRPPAPRPEVQRPGRLGGREPRRARALPAPGKHRRSLSPVFPAGAGLAVGGRQAGPRVLGAAPGARPARAAGARRRSGTRQRPPGSGAPPAGARRRRGPGPERPRAPGSPCRSGGKEEARMRNKPGPSRRRPPHPAPPPPPARGPFCREERKCDSHPRASERGRERGGESGGEEIGKAAFSPPAAVTPGPPCPLLAAPPRRPPLAEPRSLLPGSRRLRGAENTLTLAHTTNFKPAQSMSH